LSLFMYFLGGFESLSVVCNATNERAEKYRAEDNSVPNARPWSTLSLIELLRWLGGLFYMASHAEPNRKTY
jgi:hypothetical protein